MIVINSLLQVFAAAGDKCTLSNAGGGLFGFPHWYKYLDGKLGAHGECIPATDGLNDIWLIVAAVIEILLRIAALVAVAFVIYGGIAMTTSQGGEGAAKARGTVINALIGLAIAIMSAAIVSFIAGRIS